MMCSVNNTAYKERSLLSRSDSVEPIISEATEVMVRVEVSQRQEYRPDHQPHQEENRKNSTEILPLCLFPQPLPSSLPPPLPPPPPSQGGSLLSFGRPMSARSSSLCNALPLPSRTTRSQSRRLSTNSLGRSPSLAPTTLPIRRRPPHSVLSVLRPTLVPFFLLLLLPLLLSSEPTHPPPKQLSPLLPSSPERIPSTLQFPWPQPSTREPTHTPASALPPQPPPLRPSRWDAPVMLVNS